MRSLLARALQTLPEKQQLVMALHYQQDLSFAEIADVLKLTRGRISQLHSQAMASVRALLSQSQANPAA